MIKKIGLLLMIATSLVLIIAPFAHGQTRDSTITVPTSLLTDAQRQQIDTRAKVQQYGEWVGLGKEIGEAVNSSLAAVTEQTSHFAQTSVGKITMAIVVWKVVGHDILGMVFSFCLWVVILPVWIWSFKENVFTTESTKDYYGGSNGERALVILLH